LTDKFISVFFYISMRLKDILIMIYRKDILQIFSIALKDALC